jgi:hypothetical protein
LSREPVTIMSLSITTTVPDGRDKCAYVFITYGVDVDSLGRSKNGCVITEQFPFARGQAGIEKDDFSPVLRYPQ